LSAFFRGWEFNSTIYAVVAHWAGPTMAKVICGTVFAGIYFFLLWRWWQQPGELPRGDWIYGAFFLISAVVNPWYLLWLAPFVAIYPSFTGIAACIAVSLAYVHGLNCDIAGLGPYEHPVWVRPAELLVIGIGALLDYWWRPLAAEGKAG
jgi:hypothetical protein